MLQRASTPKNLQICGIAGTKVTLCRRRRVTVSNNSRPGKKCRFFSRTTSELRDVGTKLSHVHHSISSAHLAAVSTDQL